LSLSPKDIEERIRLLRAPVDIEGLKEEGVLEQDGAWLRILDPERVPEALWVQIGEMRLQEGVMSFRFPGRPGP